MILGSGAEYCCECFRRSNRQTESGQKMQIELGCARWRTRKEYAHYLKLNGAWIFGAVNAEFDEVEEFHSLESLQLSTAVEDMITDAGFT